MKTLFMILMLSAISRPSTKNTVYICDSPTGKKYHLRNDCRGLSRCTHRIAEITLEDAKKRGMGLCGYEK